MAVDVLATRRKRNLALRRVLYDAMVAAKAIDLIATNEVGYPAKETAKIAGLIMARNLDEFLSNRSGRYDDDIRLSHFGSSWVAPINFRIKDADRKRINKLVGHIVSSQPGVYRDKAAIDLIKPIVHAAVDFVKRCGTDGIADYKGKANAYALEINNLLTKLRMPVSLP